MFSVTIAVHMETQFMDSTTTAADFQVGKYYEFI
jgi:hypothetical protein